MQEILDLDVRQKHVADRLRRKPVKWTNHMVVRPLRWERDNAGGSWWVIARAASHGVVGWACMCDGRAGR
jgi:hypothetical protein